jgi:hypothetical protein
MFHHHNPYSQPIHVRAATPFNQELPSGLTPGMQIHIKGHVQGHCPRFRVDFFTASGDNALHINPRFDQNPNCIVRNTERNGQWQHEERTGGMPFVRNQGFEINIQVEHDHFKVAVNSRHEFDYRHRIPINEITRLGVDGPVDLHGITYIGTHPRAHEVLNPPVPTALPIPGGCVPGKLIQIHGSVPHHAGRFDINLQQSGQVPYPPNMGLHFNPRWNDPYVGQVVVRTNCQGGGWGPEDREHSSFPFAKGAPFEILILVEAGEFKVAVNGQHFISFPHRMPFQLNDHISFNGDVVINAVRFF